jgi:AraC-like DNA-binding protein
MLESHRLVTRLDEQVDKSRMIGSASCMAAPVSPVRVLILPPAGRPRWVCPESAQLGLVYLSWGRRRFGLHPVPISMHTGWIYTYVLRGEPKLCLSERTIKTRAGDLLIIDPDCASGWQDAPQNVSELITWVWRTAPRTPLIAPKKGGFQLFRPPSALHGVLLNLHHSCRTEVESPDEATRMAFEQIRLEIDVRIFRSRDLAAAPQSAAMRLELALMWLSQNPAEPRPVAALCRYLQISPMTLNRLFQAHLKESVASWHHRSRIQRARELMQSGNASVKEIAYLLGYKHANDFSRAIRKATGECAKNLIKKPGLAHRTRIVGGELAAHLASDSAASGQLPPA